MSDILYTTQDRFINNCTQSLILRNGVLMTPAEVVAVLNFYEAALASFRTRVLEEAASHEADTTSTTPPTNSNDSDESDAA